MSGVSTLMKILLTLLLEITTFIFIHHKTKFVDDYPNGWRQITLYALGVLFTLPFYYVFAKIFNNDEEKALIAYIAAFLGAGVGTAFGYMSTDVKV